MSYSLSKPRPPTPKLSILTSSRRTKPYDNHLPQPHIRPSEPVAWSAPPFHRHPFRLQHLFPSSPASHRLQKSSPSPTFLRPQSSFLCSREVTHVQLLRAPITSRETAPRHHPSLPRANSLARTHAPLASQSSRPLARNPSRETIVRVIASVLDLDGSLARIQLARHNSRDTTSQRLPPSSPVQPSLARTTFARTNAPRDLARTHSREPAFLTPQLRAWLSTPTPKRGLDRPSRIILVSRASGFVSFRFIPSST